MKATKNQFHTDAKTYNTPPFAVDYQSGMTDKNIIAKGQKTEKEETNMAAVEAKDKKKEMIEKSAQEFQKLADDNKMFILGYMLGIQQERQKAHRQPQTA